MELRLEIENKILIKIISLGVALFLIYDTVIGNGRGLVLGGKEFRPFGLP